MHEPGIKLTTYFSERDRSGGRLLADALFDLYERHEIHTSVLFRGVEGFGQHNQLQTDRLLTRSENLPAVSIAIDSRERIERALPAVLDVATPGLISLERAQLVTGDDLGRLQLSHDPSRALKLTLYGGRGFYADHEPFADRMFRLRRNVPVHAVIVDTPLAVKRWWPIVNELTRESGPCEPPGRADTCRFAVPGAASSSPRWAATDALLRHRWEGARAHRTVQLAGEDGASSSDLLVSGTGTEAISGQSQFRREAR